MKEKIAAVSIYMQVYNTETFLSRSVESVLNQTFKNFEFIIIDNASTDGCKEMLEQYAEQDGRITLIRREENRRVPLWIDCAKETGHGKYIMNLDSDDWVDPDCLERLVGLAEQFDADIVCTGTLFHNESDISTVGGARRLECPLDFRKSDFAVYFRFYHAFFRTLWAKLIRREVLLNADYSCVERLVHQGLSNGLDTLNAFAWLRAADSVYIDNTTMHHYLVRKGSVYNSYHPARFDSVVELHQDACDFLHTFGDISSQNRLFLAHVYINAVRDALEVIRKSQLSTAEKIKEYQRIIEQPCTVDSLCDERIKGDSSGVIKNGKRALIIYLINAVLSLPWGSVPELPTIMNKLCPKCGGSVTDKNAEVFAGRNKLLDAFVEDDLIGFVDQLIGISAEKEIAVRCNLGAMIHMLIPERTLLKEIDDVHFYAAHTEVCRAIVRGEYMDALDQMTGVLLEQEDIYGREAFLNAYLSCAAFENHIPAYIFGKIQLAEVYLKEKRYHECNVLLNDLLEMGEAQNDNVIALRKKLESELT